MGILREGKREEGEGLERGRDGEGRGEVDGCGQIHSLGTFAMYRQGFETDNQTACRVLAK